MRNLINQPVSQNIFPSNIIMDQQNLSLSSQEWPNLSPSPNPEVGRKQILKNKKCDECNFVTHKTHNLKKHKNIHKKVTPQPIETLKCQECDKTFTKKKALGDHRRRIHKKKEFLQKIHKCDACSFETHKAYNMKMHQKIHEKETLDPIALSQCLECQKAFQTKQSLIAHKKTHTNETVVQCLICEKSFSHKANLLRHTNTQHQSKKVKTNIGFGRWEESDNSNNDKSNNKKCNFCDYSSKHPHSVRRHMDKKHFKEKAPEIKKCDKCDYTTARTHDLNKHMAEVKHTKEPSRSTKYRHLSQLRKDLNCRIKAKENPAKVFGEEEVKKLLEDCNSSTREILKMIKWMRQCFGRLSFAPHIQDIICEHLNMMKPHTTGNKTIFSDKDGNNIPSVMTNIVDMNTFTAKIDEERQIKKPNLFLGLMDLLKNV